MESLNPSLTIEKQILEILRKKISDKNELQKKLDEVLEMVGLELKNKKLNEVKEAVKWLKEHLHMLQERNWSLW